LQVFGLCRITPGFDNLLERLDWLKAVHRYSLFEGMNIDYSQSREEPCRAQRASQCGVSRMSSHHGIRTVFLSKYVCVTMNTRMTNLESSPELQGSEFLWALHDLGLTYCPWNWMQCPALSEVDWYILYDPKILPPTHTVGLFDMALPHPKTIRYAQPWS
jgi:hypothetical protein